MFHGPMYLGAVAVLSLPTLSARAGPIEWATGADGAWATASNWSPATVPGIANQAMLGLAVP